MIHVWHIVFRYAVLKRMGKANYSDGARYIIIWDKLFHQCM